MQTFHDNVAPVFMQYMGNSNEHFQIVSVCMMDDAIEFGSPEAAQAYIPQVLPTFLQNITSSDNEVVRQCSCYGIAQIIVKFPTVFLQASQAQECIQGLINLVNIPQARDDDNIGVTENALFALGNLLTMPEYSRYAALSTYYHYSLITITLLLPYLYYMIIVPNTTVSFYSIYFIHSTC